MDAGWNAPIPSSVNDGAGMLWFCVAWCVHRRIIARNKARHIHQNRIRDVTQWNVVSVVVVVVGVIVVVVIVVVVVVVVAVVVVSVNATRITSTQVCA